nr:SDR family oxidoreductase [Deltaproteobacteria bacterium]
SKARFALLGRTPLDADPPEARGVTDEAGLKRAMMGAATAAGQKPTPSGIGQQVARILANREIRATLQAIEAAGGEARYTAADVSDPSALGKALDDVRASWGPIRAVVHGAGVLADKLIAEKTPEQFRKVYDTKVGGLRALLAATRHDPIVCWAMFSSVAGRCGNVGQSDYAMANEVLNKVADDLAKGGARVKSLGWGPWRGGMVNAALEARFASLGVPMIPLDVGARMFVDELRDASGAVEIVLGGEPKAEALASEGGAREVRVAVRTHRSSHPYLADHTLAGVPVVPVALALEWMAQAARAARPDLALDALIDVKVLRGIKLDQFEGAGDWFTIVAREVTNGRGAELALEVQGAGGAKHYAATGRMRDSRDAAPSAGKSPSLKLDPWKGTIYDGRLLFHGREFQMIDDVTGISKEGLSATMRGTDALGWSGADWQVDPAAVDGGLQMALLWTQHVLGGASLPMGVGGWHVYGVPAPGPLKAVLRGSSVGRDKTVSDVSFVDSSGTVVAELRGVVAVLRPGEQPAVA